MGGTQSGSQVNPQEVIEIETPGWKTGLRAGTTKGPYWSLQRQLGGASGNPHSIFSISSRIPSEKIIFLYESTEKIQIPLECLKV